MPKAPVRSPFLLLFAAIACLVLNGCSGSKGAIQATSLASDTTLAPDFSTIVFENQDANVVDIYLTDLPESVWRDGGVESLPEGVSGTAIHIHQFFRPHVTRTPIATSASNLTIQMIVISGDQQGLYGGGGFLLKPGNADAGTYGGRIRDASLRLISATPGFADLLGASEINGDVTARRDDDAYSDLSRWFSRMNARLERAAAQ